ncbi:MAG: hypothetical protein WCF40_09820 [Desulfobacterales bacterium]|jgi:hypothetical protein
MSIITINRGFYSRFDTVQKPNFQTSAESRKLFDDLALSAAAKASLAKIAPKISIAADNGKIFISILDNESGNKGEVKIKELAMQVEGVEEVVFNASEPKVQHNHVNPFHYI